VIGTIVNCDAVVIVLQTSNVHHHGHNVKEVRGELFDLSISHRCQRTRSIDVHLTSTVA
jgi:hypothetical protein